MSVSLPAFVDAWRMVEERRIFEGALPIAGFERLQGLLADDTGDVQYRLEFTRNELGGASLQLDVSAPLVLTCQRSLETFVLPVQLRACLGLIANEREESALAPGYEPLLVESLLRLGGALLLFLGLPFGFPLI